MGYFGELHPQICADYALPAGVVGFELWLDTIPLPRQKGPSKPLLKLSSLQPVTRDFAFIVDETVSAQSLIDAVRRASRDVVTDISVFDVYKGKGIEDGRKSVALAVTLQPKDSTFSEIDLIALSDQITATVNKNCGGILRGA
jgi:phenylalanyl-tRNA synthetase beta chain